MRLAARRLADPKAMDIHRVSHNSGHAVHSLSLVALRAVHLR